MNRTLMAAVAAALAMLMPVQAFAACKTIKPKTWTGSIQLANHVSVSGQDFNANNCKFHDPKLQGLDARAFDVASHRGLSAKAKWSTTHVTKPDYVMGVFYTAGCKAIPSTGFNQFVSDKYVSFKIPTSAKWLLVTPGAKVPGKDISVRVYSAGRKCP